MELQLPHQLTEDLILVRLIRSGGMAEVFLGRQVGTKGFEKTVAVKRILPHFARDEDFKQMFTYETNLCANLQHPNIVQVFREGESHGALFLVMEYVNGKNLAEFAKRVTKNKVRIPIEISCFIVMEVLKGLDFAHRFNDPKTGEPLNIIHRDISPENIMLSYEGNVKIVDFGLAKAANSLNLTKTGTVKGKPSYMSPEQVAGKTLDARSDVFSVGIVLWQLLVQRRLFKADSHIGTAMLITNKEVERPSSIRKRITEELDFITLKALEKDRKRRYQSAQEMLADMTKFMSEFAPHFLQSDVSQYIRSVFANDIAEEELEKSVAEKQISLSQSAQTINSLASHPAFEAEPKKFTRALILSFVFSLITLGAIFYKDLGLFESKEKAPPSIQDLASLTASAGPVDMDVPLNKKAMQKPFSLPGTVQWLAADHLAYRAKTPLQYWPSAIDGAKGARQAVEVGRPLWVPDVLNGMPVVRFDGRRQFLVNDEVAKSLADARGLSVFFVTRVRWDKVQYVLSFYGEREEIDILRAGFTQDSKLRLKGVKIGEYFDMYERNLAEFAVYSVIYTPEQGELFRNGDSRLSIDFSIPIDFSDTRHFTIGQDWDVEGPSDFFTGELAELVIVNRPVNDDEREKLERYLKDKYFIY